MTKFKIDKGIELNRSRSGASRKYPFGDMKVGDSFAIDLNDQYKLRKAAFAYGKNHPPVKFAVGRWEDRARVWRVK